MKLLGTPGVYILGCHGRIVYIGVTACVEGRLRSHASSRILTFDSFWYAETRTTCTRDAAGVLHGLVPSQVTERFQARDLTLYGPPNPPATWESVAWAAAAVCMVGIIVFAVVGGWKVQ